MMKLNRLTFFSFLSLLFVPFCIAAQTNTDSLKGIINYYAQVIAIDPCNAQLTVSDTTGFKKGNKVLLCQMNGATIKSSNNSDFGIIEDLRNAGKYEVNIIDSIAENTVFLQLFPKNTYDLNTAIQIVSYPYFSKAIVTDTLRAKLWDGKSGGIIAFEAGELTLNAPIVATGTGFRGGALKSYTNCDAFEFYNSYFYDVNSTSKLNGALKGEGIAAVIVGKECGRGPQGNGGGGGNNHKSGGGGGGHATKGGAGGRQNHVVPLRNCIGDYPGLGGNSITPLSTDKLFFGGGGGAGHNREQTNSAGANGGGIVIIKTNTLTSNRQPIQANGANGFNNLGDGSPGGGAGGTVLLLASQIVDTARIEAQGGKGGNSGSIQEYDFGPGGGGSGGRILMSNAARVLTTLTGGTPGTNAINRADPTQGATKGSDGVIENLTNFQFPVSIDTVFKTLMVTEEPKTISVCELKSTSLTVKAKGINVRYEWQVNKGTGFLPIVADTTFIGVGTANLIINKARTSLNAYQFRCVMTSGCTQVSTLNSAIVNINVLPSPTALFTPVITNNTVQFVNTSSNGTSYIWNFGDGRTGTSRDTTITYSQQGEYPVVLKVINNCDTVTYTTTINLNSTPKAAFESNTQSYCTPSNIQFTNKSSNNALSYKWLFPGGTPSTSTAINPSVTYTTAGSYDVVLVAINANGRDSFIKTNYIRISSAPTAVFQKIQNGNNPTINFTNQTVGATSYTWNFGDGMTSTENSPQHTYNTGGTFIVKLTASNNCGTTSAQDTVILLNRPSATISGNQSQGCTPFSVQFTGQNATNVSTWAWSFPGGTPATSNFPNPRVTYNTEGIFSVSLKVSNAAGIYETTQPDYIKVQLSPKADFDFKVTGTLVQFTNKSSSATAYKWDFGDQTVSTLTTPTDKVYNRNGNYNVTLQALNPYCGSGITRQVTIFVLPTDDAKDTEGVITASPNPTDGVLFLSFKNPLTSDYQLVVSNTNGQVLKKTTLTREAVQTLNIENFTSGVYILQFSNETDRFVKRVIKL